MRNEKIRIIINVNPGIIPEEHSLNIFSMGKKFIKFSVSLKLVRVLFSLKESCKIFSFEKISPIIFYRKTKKGNRWLNIFFKHTNQIFYDDGF